MFPNKLRKGESFSHVYDLWNQLIDYLRETRPVAGAGIRLSRTSGGMVIAAERRNGSLSVPSAANDDYNGFFKIIDVSTDGHPRIKVVDGSTWNPVTGTASPSLCRINGREVEVETWESPDITQNCAVVLQYRYTGTAEEVKLRLMKSSFWNITADRATLKFHTIGRVSLRDGVLSINQVYQYDGYQLIALSGAPSLEPFGITPIYEEPDFNGGFPSDRMTVRVNAGNVYASGRISVTGREFASSASSDGVVWLKVTAFLDDNNWQNIVYTAEFTDTYPQTNGEHPVFIRQVGAVYNTYGQVFYGTVRQFISGDYSIAGVWI